MKIGNPLKRLRLIPAVMVLSAALLVVKGAGLALDARAQEQRDTPATQATDQATQSPDPVVDDDAETSSAQVEVLTSLAKRRTELDDRERGLEMHENLIAAAEKRVDGKIDSLKQLQAQIQTLLGQRDAAEQKQLDSLVKTYASMRPRDAARIFDTLDDEVLVAVAAQLKPDVLGLILAQMQAEAAQKLTLKLANRLKLPEQAPAAPQQIAAAMPGTGAATAPPAAASAAQLPGAAPATTPPATTPAPTTGKTTTGATAPQPQASGK